MTRVLAGACLFTILPACSPRSVDRGGMIDQYAIEMLATPAVNGWRPLPDDCESACTMRLSLPGACVRPGSVIRFHAAHNPNGSINPVGTASMFNSYAAFPVLQDRLFRDGAMLTTRLTNYGGSTLISTGVPECPS